MRAGRASSSTGRRTSRRRCPAPATTSTPSTTWRCSPTSCAGCPARRGPLACEVSGGLDSSAIFAVAERSAPRGQRLLAPVARRLHAGVRRRPGRQRTAPMRGPWASTSASPIREVAPTRKPLAWYRERAQRYREFPSYPNGVMGLGIREEAAAPRQPRAAGRRGRRRVAVRKPRATTPTRWPRKPVAHARRLPCGGSSRSGPARSSLWLGVRHGLLPAAAGWLEAARSEAFVGQRDAGDRRRWSWLAPRHEGTGGAAAPANSAPAGGRIGNDTRQRGHAHDARRCLFGACPRARGAHGGELRASNCAARSSTRGSSSSRSRRPPRLRLRGLADKYLHRKAMQGLLPDVVLARQRSAEFLDNVPLVPARAEGDARPGRSRPGRRLGGPPTRRCSCIIGRRRREFERHLIGCCGRCSDARRSSRDPDDRAASQRNLAGQCNLI